MDPNMAGMNDMGGGVMGGMMKPWLHFTIGDNLFFQAWVPMSTGAVVGAAIGLFILAVVERWVATLRGVMNAHWATKAKETFALKFGNPSDNEDIAGKKMLDDTEADIKPAPSLSSSTRSNRLAIVRRSAPFVLSHELSRGALYACQAALGYTLMLAVMTFQAGYIIAIIAGLGVGEVLFGRFAADVQHH